MAFINIRAIDGNVSKKGEVSGVLETASFSLANRLPRTLRVEVTGATATEARDWLQRIKSLLEYSTLTQNPQKWRVKMEIDSKVVAATGMDKEFKQKFKDWILNDSHDGNWTATQFDQSIDHLTCNIDKGQTFGLPEIKADVNNYFVDRLEDMLHFRRFFFPDSVVDPRVTQGVIDEAANELPSGDLPEDWVHDTITKAQALSVIEDRLA